MTTASANRAEIAAPIALPPLVGEGKSDVAEATLSGGSIVNAIGRIVAMSQRLFPGPISLDYAFDPENPEDEYVVFDVVAHGEYKDYRDLEYQWHDEVRKIVPGSLGEFRLSVMPQR